MVHLQVHFYDVSGIMVGRADGNVELGAAEQAVAFWLDAPRLGGLFGYRYRVLEGSPH